MDERRRGDTEIIERIHALDLQVGKIISHMESELGSSASMGNIPKSINRISSDIAELKDLIKVQNGRLGKLENWRSGIVAIIAVFTFIIVFFKELVIKFLTK